MGHLKFSVFITLLLLFSCRKASDDNFDKNILKHALSSEISTLDPANSYDVVSATVIYQAYEQLFEYHYLKRPYKLKPLLAESMPLIEDGGKKYTIKIKKNIQYHDDEAFSGEKRYVKAQDFITQMKRLAFIPTKSNGWWLFDNKIVGLNKFRKEAGSDFKKFESLNVNGLKAPDDHTLVIELVKPYPQMLFALAMSFTSPMPIEVVKKYENVLISKMVGTGPFTLNKWMGPAGVKLRRFKSYRKSYYPSEGDRLANSSNLLRDAGKQIPFLDGIDFTIIKESNTRWLNFRKKKIDTLNLPKDNYASAVQQDGTLTPELKSEGIKVQGFPTLTYWWLSFNMKDPIVGKNLNLRKAIAHAINNERYIRDFTNNIALKANSIYPPGVPGYNPSAKLPYEYNLEKAKEYLAKAGYPGGKGLPEITFDVRGVNSEYRQRADFVSTYLGKIGIKIKPQINTFSAFLQKARSGDLQFWIDGWAMDYPDAENSLQLLISKNHPPGPNTTSYSNSKVDALVKKLSIMNDGPEKFKIMNEIETIVHKELPWIMQYYSRNYILYHGYLNNYRPSDIIYNNFKYLRLTKP